jgi:hypothetical protein
MSGQIGIKQQDVCSFITTNPVKALLERLTCAIM